MGISMVVPAIFTIAVGLAAARLHRRVHPSLAAIAYSSLAVVGAVGAASVVVAVSLLVLTSLPSAREGVARCMALAGGERLPFWIAVTALVGLVAMVRSTGRTARRIVSSSRARFSGDELVVVPDDAPSAYAVPGRPGHIVVSTGMLKHLDAGERRVLLAHERAHLRRRHHRYLWITDLATAAVPVLDPLRRRVRIATERWADEDAAREVGDRALVARAIGRAALAQHDGPLASPMHLAADGVGERVEAMLRPAAPRAGALAAAFAVTTALVVGILGSTLQLHHVASLAFHVCGRS